MNRGIKPNCNFFIGCYPRSGSTWLQNMMYELISGEIPDPDHMRHIMPLIGRQNEQTPVLLGAHPRSRIIKTHHVFRSSYRKAIYLVRDPRRVAISQYKRKLLYGGYNGTFEQWISFFAKGIIQGKRRWDKHVASWLKAADKHPERIMIIRFVDMQVNTFDTMLKVLDFIGLERSKDKIESAILNNSLK